MRAMGAVRQSRRDTWDPTDAVIAYRKWRDRLREHCGVAYGKNGRLVLDTRFRDADEVCITAYFISPTPSLYGQFYKETPDADNIYKAVTDALFVNDQGIAVATCAKRWGERNEMRIVLTNVLR